MMSLDFDPHAECVYCGAAWKPDVGGFSHVCSPPVARHVTLAESLALHLGRLNEQRPRKRASKPRVKLGEVFGGLPLAPRNPR